MINYIDIKEFREKGYLQELNRRFLHPLGLALEVKINENGVEELSGIWDYRNDAEGIIFLNIDKTKKEFIDKALEKSVVERNKLFGSNIQPLWYQYEIQTPENPPKLYHQ